MWADGCFDDPVAHNPGAVRDRRCADARRGWRCSHWRAVRLAPLLALLLAWPAHAASGAAAAAPWWLWPLALFVVSFAIGVVAVPAGIGGGTLFVPIVGGFFPFHLDFVRGAGLLVALASAVSAAPLLLRGGLASLRLALPLALLATLSSIGGALLGLALPARSVQLLLGGVVLAVAVFMLVARTPEARVAARPDALSRALALHGVFVDQAGGASVAWQARRTGWGLAAFVGIGVLAGLFGIGAGWANVPVLNLVMGVPLKVAAGTSGLVISLVNAPAWIYLNQGAVLPIVAVPAVIGMMLGAHLGARLLAVLNATLVRRLVIALLFLAGVRVLLDGLGVGR